MIIDNLSEHLKLILKVEHLQPAYIPALAIVDENLLSRLVRALFPEFKNNPLACAQFSEFLETVSHSSIGMTLWVSNLLSVYGWLGEEKKIAKFSDIVQYTSCYLESNSSDAVTDFLDHYGFERAISK